jgi:hypothetical protein
VKALGKKPLTENGSPENEQHFHDALMEAANKIERMVDIDTMWTDLERLVKELRISAGEKP